MRTAELAMHSGADLCKTAISVAHHYGFLPLRDMLAYENPQGGIKLPRGNDIDSLRGELVTPIQYYIHASLSRPTLAYHLQRESKHGSNQALALSIAALGIEQSIAEALILKTAFSILEEIGEKDAVVHINSIGDRESSAKFIRECSSYFRRHLDTLGPQAQHIVRRDTLEALEYLSRRNHELLEDIPHPVDFLSEQSRKHFREVIEYLENGNILYELNHTLVGDCNCYSNTLFEIRASDEDSREQGTVLAKGGRCDEFAKKFFKTNLPSVGIVFFFKPKKRERRMPESTLRKPKIYFIHLGSEAKLQSLRVVETLRRAKIPFRHALSKEHLTNQLREAEDLQVPYAIIMGQKEALEGSVIVRDMESRAQETVFLQDLPARIKSSL